MTTNWSLTGPKRTKPRASFTISAVAVLLAAETFAPVQGSYPLYMCILVWLSAAWITWFSIKAKALLGFLCLPVSAFWLIPVLGGNWFNQVGIEFFLTHAAAAILWAACAYTFLATEKPAK